MKPQTQPGLWRGFATPQTAQSRDAGAASDLFNVALTCARFGAFLCIGAVQAQRGPGFGTQPVEGDVGLTSGAAAVSVGAVVGAAARRHRLAATPAAHVLCATDLRDGWRVGCRVGAIAAPAPRAARRAALQRVEMCSCVRPVADVSKPIVPLCASRAFEPGQGGVTRRGLS